MRRGEVWWADLEPRSGSEQRGRRPVLVVSHDAFNQTQAWLSVIVVPISTSARQALRGPTSVPVGGGLPGLAVGSVGLCHQVTTLDRRKLTRCLGAVSAQDLDAIHAGLKVAMNLP